MKLVTSLPPQITLQFGFISLIRWVNLEKKLMFHTKTDNPMTAGSLRSQFAKQGIIFACMGALRLLERIFLP